MRFIHTALFFITASLLLSCQHKHQQTSKDLSGNIDPVSPIPSSVDGVRLNNTHVVVSDDHGPKILRSQSPRVDSDYIELNNLNLSDILIFKNGDDDQVKQEISRWQSMGISSSRIKTIPFPYKNFPDFKTPCKQTIAALDFINKARRQSNSRVLFHCTVGEDRTGYLAGLVRLLESNIPIKEVFQYEMCEKGYSAGDPRKPATISTQIDQDVTPVFLKMAFFIKSGQLSWTKLNPGVCDRDPTNDSAFKNNTEFNNPEAYKCDPVSL